MTSEITFVYYSTMPKENQWKTRKLGEKNKKLALVLTGHL